MSEITELFERLSHPTRVKILKLLESTPMGFSQLKEKLGIESSGNLDHHLKKLENLVCMGENGLYRLSDEGKEALKAIRSIEVTMTERQTYPVARSRWVLGILGAILVTFLLVTVIAVIPMGVASTELPSLIGVVGGTIGAVVGVLGSLLGLRASIVADGKSRRALTYWPSQKSPWTTGDWIANLLLFSSYLSLLFCLIYVQIFSSVFLHKPLWYTASLLALITMFIGSSMISSRILVKANRIIEHLAQS